MTPGIVVEAELPARLSDYDAVVAQKASKQALSAATTAS
ncbi:hypothetical protein JOF48_000652 [Arthrobacter stackebrandtii]|uniref:Uncharacterized protein n=1 Tax=Arthrobacter stackebrandtii TaxID=272161 RepID=A0ABS4YV92_9MICC|nr:hypothetical protein [Arthrobacter stackebrandtii]